MFRENRKTPRSIRENNRKPRGERGILKLYLYHQVAYHQVPYHQVASYPIHSIFTGFGMIFRS